MLLIFQYQYNRFIDKLKQTRYKSSDKNKYIHTNTNMGLPDFVNDVVNDTIQSTSFRDEELIKNAFFKSGSYSCYCDNITTNNATHPLAGGGACDVNPKASMINGTQAVINEANIINNGTNAIINGTYAINVIANGAIDKFSGTWSCIAPDLDSYTPVMSHIEMLFWILLFSLMILIAAGGNMIVIYIVSTNREMKSVTNYFLVNLSLADTMVSTLNVIFNLISMLISYWPFGNFYCKISNFIAILSISASVFTLTAISWDR